MDQGVKIVEMKCQGCGSTLKMPDGNTKIVQCEYCGNTYVIESPYKVPDWKPLPPERDSQSPSLGTIWFFRVVFILGIVVTVFGYVWYRNVQENRKEVTLPIVTNDSGVTYGESSSDAEREKAFSGILGQMLTVAFGKDAESLTEQELAKIQWIADWSDLDNSYLGYSFENPLENPDAEIEWLTFPRGSESGYTALYRCTGLKVFETKESLSKCNFQGLQLEGLSAPFYSLEEVAEALGDTSSLRQLTISSRLEQINGLELFPNIEILSVNAGKLSDLDAVAALKHLKSLTIKNADGISNFSVLASVEGLEELFIDAENLKSLEFLKRLSGLKCLGISDGKLLDLDGIEVLVGLERLSIKDCSDLADMSNVSALVGLKELTLEKPYNCPEPSLEGLVNLQNLTLKGFHNCDFLPHLTNLESLTLQNCDLSPNLNLSGLTQLTKLMFTTGMQDRSLNFVNSISSLEDVNLSGMVTYNDISGIFALPRLKQLNISGIECEIDFDRVVDNPSLESLEMAGIKLYKNVKIWGGGGIVNIDWDDVYLVDHLDFLGHFPNLKRLNVADNEIKELDFTSALLRLEEIDFSDNYVTDMHILAALSDLRLVNCKGNPISNLRVLDDAYVNIVSD